MPLLPVVKPHHSWEAMAAVVVAMAVAAEVVVDAAGRAHQQDVEERQDLRADTATCMATMVILARGAIKWRLILRLTQQPCALLRRTCLPLEDVSVIFDGKGL